MKMLKIKVYNTPYESVQRVSSQQQAQQEFSTQRAGSRALRFLFASASMESQISLAEMEYERQLEQLITTSTTKFWAVSRKKCLTSILLSKSEGFCS
jgi:hypothetical protein